MEYTDIMQHIKEFCSQRNWTIYKLAKESGVPYSSLNMMLKKEQLPSMKNIIKICQGFDITLSEFFSGIEIPADDKTEFIRLWSILDKDSKKLTMTYMHGLARRKID